MSFDRQLLAFIARRSPAVFDVVPRGGQLVSLNPQPIPPGVETSVGLNPQPLPPGPGDLVSLNPQPLPPRELGARVAVDLLQLSSLAARLKTDVLPIAEWMEDPCPVWPEMPTLPVHLGSVPEADPGPDWLLDYHLGLASTLAQANENLGDVPFVSEALERSSQALSDGLS